MSKSVLWVPRASPAQPQPSAHLQLHAALYGRSGVAHTPPWPERSRAGRDGAGRSGIRAELSRAEQSRAEQSREPSTEPEGRGHRDSEVCVCARTETVSGRCMLRTLIYIIVSSGELLGSLCEKRREKHLRRTRCVRSAARALGPRTMRRRPTGVHKAGTPREIISIS